MGALLTHGRALGNAGADHHGATIHPGDDPPGVPEGCVDELGWTNRWGDTCVRLHDRCRDGAFIHGHIHEFTTGEPYNYPERACCACGGGVVKDLASSSDEPFCVGGLALPRLFVIGAQKCATTTFHNELAARYDFSGGVAGWRGKVHEWDGYGFSTGKEHHFFDVKPA